MAAELWSKVGLQTKSALLAISSPDFVCGSLIVYFIIGLVIERTREAFKFPSVKEETLEDSEC